MFSAELGLFYHWCVVFSPNGKPNKETWLFITICVAPLCLLAASGSEQMVTVLAS